MFAVKGGWDGSIAAPSCRVPWPKDEVEPSARPPPTSAAEVLLTYGFGDSWAA